MSCVRYGFRFHRLICLYLISRRRRLREKLHVIWCDVFNKKIYYYNNWLGLPVFMRNWIMWDYWEKFSECIFTRFFNYFFLSLHSISAAVLKSHLCWVLLIKEIASCWDTCNIFLTNWNFSTTVFEWNFYRDCSLGEEKNFRWLKNWGKLGRWKLIEKKKIREFWEREEKTI